jgi:hypothetical protein
MLSTVSLFECSSSRSLLLIGNKISSISLERSRSGLLGIIYCSANPLIDILPQSHGGFMVLLLFDLKRVFQIPGTMLLTLDTAR